MYYNAAPKNKKGPSHHPSFNLTPLLKLSDASVDLIWKYFVLYDTGFIFL